MKRRRADTMKLEQLHYLSEAVKYKSISVAAEENFISQPSFSASITKLEKELGVTLLMPLELQSIWIVVLESQASLGRSICFCHNTLQSAR